MRQRTERVERSLFQTPVARPLPIPSPGSARHRPRPRSFPQGASNASRSAPPNGKISRMTGSVLSRVRRYPTGDLVAIPPVNCPREALFSAGSDWAEPPPIPTMLPRLICLLQACMVSRINRVGSASCSMLRTAAIRCQGRQRGPRRRSARTPWCRARHRSSAGRRAAATRDMLAQLGPVGEVQGPGRRRDRYGRGKAGGNPPAAADGSFLYYCMPRLRAALADLLPTDAAVLSADLSSS